MLSLASELRREVADFRDVGVEPYVRRDVRVAAVDYSVSVIIGARRCGKSFRTYQLIDELVANGTIDGLHRICPVDFDNPHLGSIAAGDLGHVRDEFLAMTPGAGPREPLLFVFDEIHRIPGWEDFVVDLSRNRRWKVVVTGSSSRMLRTDVSTSLRGKSLTTTMYPLSFSEFLRFAGVDASTVDSTEGRARVRAEFERYLRWGGFPAVARSSEADRELLLREYFDTMILRDIIQRYNISRPRQCTELLRYLLALAGKPFTTNSAMQFLRDSGEGATNTLVADYISWAVDSWLLFSVPIYSDSERTVRRNYHKCYCIDWALATINSRTWDGTWSRAFENMVYLHLRRQFPRVDYYLTRKQRQEVDFIAVDNAGKPRLAVQACLDLTDEDVLGREIPPLASAARYFAVDEALVVTNNEDRTIECDGVTIRLVPAWRWMLSG